jgi:hypothetical protein
MGQVSMRYLNILDPFNFRYGIDEFNHRISVGREIGVSLIQKYVVRRLKVKKSSIKIFERTR